MKIYRSKVKKLHGTNYREIYPKAYNCYKIIKRKSKRRPYIKSSYFKNKKVFLELFWFQIRQKLNLRDKSRRLKYFPCAIDLIKNSKCEPDIKIKHNEVFYRFYGMEEGLNIFCVQIKMNWQKQ